jgi:hypothetical protein
VADYYGWKGDKPKLVVHWGNNLTYCHADSMHGSRVLAMANAGAKTIVIDPVYTNLAQKADLWLPVKPATDTALAMGFLNVIVNENLYDQEFVQKWSNLVGLVREDNGVMLTEYALRGEEPEPFHGPPFAVKPPEKIVVWDADTNTAVIADGPGVNAALSATVEVKLGNGETVKCRTAWDLFVERLKTMHPKGGEITWVPKKIEVRRIALRSGFEVGRLPRPVGRQLVRAVQAAMMLVALTDLDRPGSNVGAVRQRVAGFPGEIKMGFSGNVRADLRRSHRAGQV